MGRTASERSPLAVERLTTPGMHSAAGVSGLALQVLPTGGLLTKLPRRPGGDLGRPLKRS